MFVNGANEETKEEILIQACEKLLYSGYYPSNKEQGYVFRKLLRELYRLGSQWDNEHYLKEKKRQDKVVENYNRNKNKAKYQNKSIMLFQSLEAERKPLHFAIRATWKPTAEIQRD